MLAGDDMSKKQTVYQASHAGEMGIETQEKIKTILKESGLTPILGVGILENLKLWLLRG